MSATKKYEEQKDFRKRLSPFQRSLWEDMEPGAEYVIQRGFSGLKPFPDWPTEINRTCGHHCDR